MNKVWMCAAVLGLFSSSVSAQLTASERNITPVDFNTAKELFRKEIYLPAQKKFHDVSVDPSEKNSQNKETAAFYDRLIALMYEEPSADIALTRYLKDHPQSTLLSQSSLPLADFYLAKKDFTEALAYLNQVNPTLLNTEQNNAYLLRLGYARFMTGDESRAAEALQEAYQTENEDLKNRVGYMLGHIAYIQGDTDKAFEYFNQLPKNEEYQKLVQPYQIQKDYNSGNYEAALAEAREYVNTYPNSPMKAELDKIIGESLFMQKNYAEAYPYLKKYAENTATPSAASLYQLGFVAAQNGQYEDAVSYYNQIINAQNEFGQNAYYQLGNAYLKTGKKEEALSAFKNASELDFDADTKKKAFRQYAKLSYDIGNPFESAPVVLKKYRETYGEDAEMERYLVKSYLYSGDEQATLDAIESLRNPNAELRQIYQEVSFRKGAQAYNSGNLAEAETYFLKSVHGGENKVTYARARYYLAEIDMAQGKYADAVTLLSDLQKEKVAFEESERLLFDLGFAYFKNNQLVPAKISFREYLNQPNAEFRTEALLRLADIARYENDTEAAARYYAESKDTTGYAAYQTALLAGNAGDQKKKINELNEFLKKYPKSDYREEAQLELASSYAVENNFKASNALLNDLVSSAQTSPKVKVSAESLKIMNLYEAGKKQEAFAALDVFANQYVPSGFGQEVTETAKSLHTADGNISDLENFAQKHGLYLDRNDVALLKYNVANDDFIAKKYNEAIQKYIEFLDASPKSSERVEATYRLAESYYQTKNYASAKVYFNEAAQTPSDEQERAKARLSQILLTENKADEALPILESLAASTDTQISEYATAELLNLYLKDRKLSDAVRIAEASKGKFSTNKRLQESIQLAQAQWAFQNNNLKTAKNIYQILEKSSIPSIAAEALYYKAYFQHQDKQYKSSNQSVFRLANTLSSETYWGAKALLLLAKNYWAMKDKYQTHYTLDQVIVNFSEYPDIIAEAQQLKKTYK